MMRLRAMRMLELRVTGHSIKEIAEKYRCHPRTVARAIQLAKREGMIEKLENSVLWDLAPLAVKVYKEKLIEGDEFVAKDVLAMTMKLGEGQRKQNSDEKEQTLDGYLRGLRDSGFDPTNLPITVEVLTPTAPERPSTALELSIPGGGPDGSPDTAEDYEVFDPSDLPSRESIDAWKAATPRPGEAGAAHPGREPRKKGNT